MALSSKEFQEIQAALLDGYGDLFDLRQMVRFGLDDSLDAIAGGRNLTEQIFNLIEWADRKGRVLDLVRSAYEYNQGNEALKQLYDAWIAPQEREEEGQPSIEPSIVSTQTAQVFLSYSSQDTDSMHRVVKTMREQNISVWISEGLEPGTPGWQAAIESALRNSKCMVVLLSPDAKQSEWVEREISVTQRLGRRIFPVLIRGTHDEAVPFSLETVQYIDARQEYQQMIENHLVPSVTRYLGVAKGVVNGQQVDISPVDTLVEELEDEGGVAEPDSVLDESVAVEGEGERLRVEIVEDVDTGLGGVEGDDGHDKIAVSRPSSKPSQKTSRKRFRIIVGVIIFVGIVVGVVVVQRDVSSRRDAEATREAEMTVTAQLAVVKMTASAIQAAVSPDEFANIPFVYVPDGDFWIMQTEVTNAMWQRFLVAGGYSNDDYWDDPEGRQWRDDNAITEPSAWDDSRFNQDKQPVVGVSWYEAEAFAKWFSEESGRPMRLPTNAEWGTACAGTDGREYPWGDVPAPSRALLNYYNNVGSTTEVGSYPDGVSPYGVLDMAGNAWEWTEENSSRGGSWDYYDRNVRCAYQLYYVDAPGYGDSSGGFRVLSPGF